MRAKEIYYSHLSNGLTEETIVRFAVHFEILKKSLITHHAQFVDAMEYPSSSDEFYEPRYSINEVNLRAAEIKQFLAAIDSNQPNAQGAYDTFQVETATAVETHMKVC